MKPDLNNGDYFNLQRGLFLHFNGFSPNNFKKPYALFNPTMNNPNQVRSTWINILYPPGVKRGRGFGFGDYDSGSRGFGGAIFDHEFGNSFATMRRRAGDYVRQNY